MANKLIKQKHNTYLTGRRNYFDGLTPTPTGTSFLSQDPMAILALGQGPLALTPTWAQQPTPAQPSLNHFDFSNSGLSIQNGQISFTKPTPSTTTVAPPTAPQAATTPSKGGITPLGKAAIGAAAGAGGQIGGGLLSGGLESTAGSAITGIGGAVGGAVGMFNPLLGGIISGASGILGGLTNRMFGSKMNDQNIAKYEAANLAGSQFTSNASNFDQLATDWGSHGISNFTKGDVGKDGWFSSKASDKFKELQKERELALAHVANELNNNASNLVTSQQQGLLANYAAFGGELNTQGADFTNGLTFIDAGGRHETNPNEGVPMGVDQEGTPNLVEEGEVVYNDYVFSDRLRVPKAVRNKYKLRGAKSITFADAAKQMSKESEERPNDPISQRGLESNLIALMMAQEQMKMGGANRFAFGGNLFSGGGGLKSWTTKRDIEDNLPWLRDLYSDDEWDALFDNPGKTDDKRNIIAKNNTGLYDPNGAYMQRLNATLNQDAWNNWTDDQKEAFVQNLKTINPETYADFTVANVGRGTWSWDNLRRLATDGNVGGHHQVGNFDASKYLSPTNKYKVWQRDPNGGAATALDLPEYYSGNQNGYTWQQAMALQHPELKYVMMDEGTLDSGTNTKTYNIYFDPVSQDKDEPEVEDIDLSSGENDYPKSDNWLRYAPALGNAIGLGMSIFSKPDESSANAILEATRSAAQYQPISFIPVGNYLTYRPLDRDYYLNALNAQAGATRRNVLNTAGGNRGTALAGLLAADYNAINGVGDMLMKQELFNREQEQKVEEFNRATNMFNSEGFFKADQANQAALTASRDTTLKGTMAAEELRQNAKLAREAAISSNLTNLFDNLGAIGQQNVINKQYDWYITHAAAPSQKRTGEDAEVETPDGQLLPGQFGYRSVRSRRALGGKIKRKKGFTI